MATDNVLSLPGSCCFVPSSCDFPLKTEVLYFSDGLAYLRALTFLAVSTPEADCYNADRQHARISPSFPTKNVIVIDARKSVSPHGVCCICG